jgi:type I restriction enzyme S subunit
MELKPGYKQTEVGVIPEDWNIHLIQKLLDEKTILDHIDGNHGELYPRSHEFKPYGVPYVSANTLEDDGQVNFSACKFLSKERAAKFQKGIAKNGDVLFAHNATVGPTAILRTKLDCIILSTTVTYYRCDPDKLYNTFLLYSLQAPFFVKQYQAVMSQSTRNQVPITAQRKFSVALPPTLKEQTAIANALSDADALIQSLTRLIAKKRQIKQGAMQTLLDPYENGRLKAGWEEKKLGEIGVFRGGSGFPTRYQGKTEGLYPFYKVSDMNNEGNEKLMVNANNWIDEKAKKEIGSITFPKNTIIFAKIGAAIFLERKKILNQESCIDNNMMGYVFDTNLYNVEYLHYLFQTIPLGKLVSTTALPSLNGKEISVQKYYFPNKLEQTRIATILSGMDAEIAALETKLAKYRHIKQGMMQNLLTGKIRLI